MATLWNADDRRSLEARIDRLSPDMTARWGKFSSRAMLAHLTDASRMALGEITARPKRLPVRYFPLRELFVYVLPFPRHAPTAPELLGRIAEDWDAERREWHGTVARLVERSSGSFPEHPAFGRMSVRAWGVLIYRHTDHHLRQFGA